jgi:hypothetical protein
MDAKSAAQAARSLVAGFDPRDADGLARELQALWLRAAPGPAPELEPESKQLFKNWGIADSQFQAVGVPVPVLTAIGKEIGRSARQDVTGFVPLTRLLWESYGREGRIVAVVALGPMELADPEAIVPLLRELAASCAFWEDCDQLAMKALEPVLRRDPGSWLEPVGAWVLDENKWIRRAGLTALGRLPMEWPMFAARCVELEAPALGDPDTDVKRALSFALRQNARGDVEPVKELIRTHATATDPHVLWVMCDVIRSLWTAILPEFVDLLPIYRRWLETAEPRARRSVQAAIRLLEGADR